MPVIYASAPDGDEALQEAERMRKEIRSVLLIQELAHSWIQRHRDRVAMEATESHQRALDYAASGATRGWARPPTPPPEAEPESDDEDEEDGDMAFTIRNVTRSAQENGTCRGAADRHTCVSCVWQLDTGEATAVPVEDGEAGMAALRSKLSFGELQPRSEAWEATKTSCRGILEKLARKSTFSFRGYQVCVWQERYVYAEDDALCYQQLKGSENEREPHGPCKRIPFASMEFVGPFDDTQFVVLCVRRAYTFLCESPEARTRWIKAISQLAGCSASTEVCRRTLTTSSRRSRSQPRAPPVRSAQSAPSSLG